MGVNGTTLSSQQQIYCFLIVLVKLLRCLLHLSLSRSISNTAVYHLLTLYIWSSQWHLLPSIRVFTNRSVSCFIYFSLLSNAIRYTDNECLFSIYEMCPQWMLIMTFLSITKTTIHSFSFTVNIGELNTLLELRSIIWCRHLQRTELTRAVFFPMKIH